MKLDDLKAELDDAAKGLAYNSIQNGCADCGLAANLATRSLTAITDLEALVGELGEALANINRKASPDPERTMSEASNDLYWCACEARATLAKLEKARGKDQTDG